MKVYVQAEAPRVCSPDHGVVIQQFPWVPRHSKFTRNFENTVVWLSLHLSRKAVSEYLRISLVIVEPIISRIEKGLSANNQPLDNLVNIGIDETSYKKGQNTSPSLSIMTQIRLYGLPKGMVVQNLAVC